MEFAGGAALGKELHAASIASAYAASVNVRRGLIGKVSVFPRRSRGCFADDGHLRYYGSPVRCGGRKEEKMMVKRREKLVKGLVGLQAAGGLDLAAMAGCEVEDGKVTVDKVADALLARLDLLRAEEKEMKKRRKKEQKAATKTSGELTELPCEDTSSSSSEDEDDNQMNTKTTMNQKSEKKTKKMMMMEDCDNSSSSSSSSESSDSDCEDEPLAIKDLRTITAEALPENKPQDNGANISIAVSPKIEAHCNAAISIPAKKIEVCMGGKCKKSGAIELMEEFQRRIGEEEAVVGCKCMGKCKQAPSVRIRSSARAETGESMTPLFLGVGIQDVGAIVADLFPKNEDLGLAAA